MCTGIRIKAENNSVVYGRTLEFGRNIESKVLFVPRNYEFAGTAPNGSSEGLSWKSKFAVIGANALNEIDFVDGVNEAGLAGGLFYFPEYARYQEIEKDLISKSIAPWELLTWILTNFSSIDQIKIELPKIKVTNTVFKSWGIVLPIHAIIHDSSGHSLVIEYIEGNLKMQDNPIGVFTNSPNFDWHITNLRNYVNLSPFNISEVELNNIELMPLSQGSGMFGMPGDFTSSSRFIRAFFYSQSAVDIKDENDALKSLFHILNLFDIPYGSVRQKENVKIEYEYTQWTSGIDLKNKYYYFHSYDNRNLRKIDLMKMDLDQKNHNLVNM
jgi:choloylglycine hydrolase